METIKLRDEFIKLGQRGKKLHAGDVVEYDGQTVKITD